MNSGILKYFVLPKEATAVELRHVQRINRVALIACLAHLPLFMLVAWLCNTSMAQAIGFGGALVLGPAVANFTLKNPRTLSLVFGFTSMALGALLVHLGQGPMQIEMHFHFFAALALLTVWGNPLIIWVATVTVALHHGLFWLLLPRSVFNYEASLWVVVVHATFVVVEAVAAAFIARNFFDNVIELEKVVQKKTEALAQRNEDMKTILDNAAQGFMTVAIDGTIEPERSAVVATWLGKVDRINAFDAFARLDSSFGMQLRQGWDALREDIMPLEVIVDQLPKTLTRDGLTLGFEYRPILEKSRISKILVVISDLTAQVERAKIERAQAETMTIFEKINRDRSGFLEFIDEGSKLVAAIAANQFTSQADCWRAVHTLKGTSGLFGVTSVADSCHAIEDQMADDQASVRPDSGRELQGIWTVLTEKVKPFLGQAAGLSIGEQDLIAALATIQRGASREEILHLLSSWRYEPLQLRFQRFAEQAAGLADRLDKNPLSITVEDHNLRLPQQKWAPFWSAFAHAIRNAVDHGIETPDARQSAGKPAASIKLSSEVHGDRLSIAIEDNGRGIDWQAVKERCRAKGLPAATQRDLEKALFGNGFSTKTDITATSGRGVGMGSLEQECIRLGGAVTLTSTQGQGTRLVFDFPLEAMLERVSHKRAA